MDKPLSFDYDNAEPLLKKTKELESLLLSKDFQMFLYGGTLLGCVRDKDLIPHDDDIDIFYISKKSHRKAVLVEFDEVIKPLLEKNGWEVNPISWSLNGPKLMMGQYHIIKDGISLDLWTAWIDRNDKFNVTMTVENTHITAKDILPGVKGNIRDYEFTIPQNYDLFLEHLYGPTWTIPDSKYKIPANKNFLQKTVLKIIDQFGWAYYFIAKEQQKYSYHNIEYKRLKDSLTDNIPADIVYFHSPCMGEKDIRNIIQNKINRKKTKIIGAYGGENDGKYPDADLIVTISFPFLYKLKEIYKNIQCMFLPEAIDTEYFSPNKRKKNKFTVGYVGRPSRIKRTHLLKELKYEVQTHMEWGPTYFVEGRTLDNVKNFYQSIDCLVLTSKSECMPRVVLEAMSMGLPVISTDVGCLRMLLDEEWIVPNTTEEEIVKNINYRLDILNKYPSVRKAVGKRNRKYILENFNWEDIQQLWDEVFNALYINNKDKLTEIADKLEERWKPFYQDVIRVVTPPLDGEIENITIFNKALSEPEIKTMEKQPVFSNTTEERLKEFISINKLVCLNETCLSIIQNQDFSGKVYHLGYSEKQIMYIAQKLKLLGFFNETKNFFRLEDIIVHLSPYSRGTKVHDCNGFSVTVPYPVVPYLRRLYGKNWKNHKLDK